MTNLKISRSSSFPDLWRRYKIFVDGKPVASLLPDEMVDLSVSPGEHSLEARIDWCSATPMSFTIPESGSVDFEVSTNLHGFRAPLALFIMIFARKTYLSIKQVA